MYRPGPPGWASVLSMTTDAVSTAPEPEKSMRERMLAGELYIADDPMRNVYHGLVPTIAEALGLFESEDTPESAVPLPASVALGAAIENCLHSAGS